MLTGWDGATRLGFDSSVFRQFMLRRSTGCGRLLVTQELTGSTPVRSAIFGVGLGMKIVIPVQNHPRIKLTECIQRLDYLPPGEVVFASSLSSAVEDEGEDPKSLSPDPQEG